MYRNRFDEKHWIGFTVTNPQVEQEEVPGWDRKKPVAVQGEPIDGDFGQKAKEWASSSRFSTMEA